MKHAGVSKMEVANTTHNLICILFGARCKTLGVEGSSVPYLLLLIYILPFLLTTDVRCHQRKLQCKRSFILSNILELHYTFKVQNCILGKMTIIQV